MYKILTQCRRPIASSRPVERSASAHQATIVHRQLCCPFITSACQHRRSLSTGGTTTDPPSPRPLVNFAQLIGDRRHQASRSVLVQVNSERSHPELHRYCRQFGSIRSSLHYQHDDMHYILLEFAEAAEALAAVRSGVYNEACTGTVVQSPFLWFRAGPKAKLTQAEAPVPTGVADAAATLDIVDGTAPTAPDAVYAALSRSRSVDEQMRSLHEATRLNDCGTRLRFLAARQIEQSLHGMFPHARAFPFGSSVNGFGRTGCDLDMILRLSADAASTDEEGAAAKARAESRLVFHTKELAGNGRTQQQRELESVGDLLQLFLPGVCHVRRILQARVPIVKYQHDHLDLEVDLSMSNLSGVYMSELLYMFGQLDERVQPLVFTVRHWAQAVGLTNASPGRWISNFSLTCLVIFYLQQLPQPILPAVNQLIKNARRPADVRITEDGINCTFLRDLPAVRELQKPAANTSSLHELLLGFFEFYAQLNFADRALSLNEGRLVVKPDASALYIVNPLEVLLNVSKNISPEECQRLRIEVRNAAWALDSFGEPPASGADADWGVLSIARASAQTASGSAASKTIIRPNMFYRPRMVDVSDLFAKDDGAGETKTKTTNGKPAGGFKNSAVKGMVEKIQRQGRESVQKLSAEFSRKSSTDSTRSADKLPTRVRKT